MFFPLWIVLGGRKSCESLCRPLPQLSIIFRVDKAFTSLPSKIYHVNLNFDNCFVFEGARIPPACTPHLQWYYSIFLVFIFQLLNALQLWDVGIHCESPVRMLFSVFLSYWLVVFRKLFSMTSLTIYGFYRSRGKIVCFRESSDGLSISCLGWFCPRLAPTYHLHLSFRFRFGVTINAESSIAK